MSKETKQRRKGLLSRIRDTFKPNYPPQPPVTHGDLEKMGNKIDAATADAQKEEYDKMMSQAEAKPRYESHGGRNDIPPHLKNKRQIKARAKNRRSKHSRQVNQRKFRVS